jgi:hypothetical protein
VFVEFLTKKDLLTSISVLLYFNFSFSKLFL